MKTYKLGQEIKFNKKLVRIYGSNIIGYKKGDPNKQWREKDLPETKGLVIGIRTLFDSHVDYCHDFIACENVNPKKALLVAFNIRRKPVLIPLSGVV